jgi:hypothetical protein
MPGDTGQPYTRPREGFRFALGGVKTNAVPDALPPDKYPYAQNLRSYLNDSVRTRGGMQLVFSTTASPITDLRSYTELGEDNLPQFLTRNAADGIWLGTLAGAGSSVGSLAGGGASPGASMIPFRPAQSPNPWMYIANGSDYKKFSAPAASVVTQQKVGIAEPQVECEAALGGVDTNFLFYLFSSNPAYAASGVASSAVNQTRITDTVQSVFSDPAYSSLYTVGVTSMTGLGDGYNRQMVLSINAIATTVQDVYPAQTNPIGIAGIYYYSGSTGRCVVVPKNMTGGPGTEGQSIYTQNFLASLRRGSLVKFSGGSETCIVWSVTEGPDGTVCFETSTTGTHTTAETFTQPPAIQVLGGAPVVGQTITSQTVGFNLSGAGLGTQTSTASLGSPFVATNYSFQPEDYFHVSVAFVTLASLNEFKVLLDVGDGTFTSNFYYYTIRVADIQAAVNNSLTQLGAAQLVTQRALIDDEQSVAVRNQGTTTSGDQMTPGDGQWADIIFPISSFTRVGTDTTKSLQTVNAIQFLFNMNAATDCSIGWNSVVGGGEPDVGPSSAPYRYRVRPRSSVTGAKGNPSPDMRYGINPRRCQTTVYLPSASYDAQIDTWDIFRYGGTITSWRKIGQTASSNTSFIDNYDDDAASEGEELEEDNLEPWPTIDVPLSVVSGSTSIVGTTAFVPMAAASNVLRYLPGNLVQLGGINVYTLRTRPTLISGAYVLFQFVENAGVQSGVPVTIYEPAMARQFLPYMAGPDAAGTVFAWGDPLRPGTVSFAKNYAPDAAPDSYNIEVTPPSEPMLAGEVIDGLFYSATPERWWAWYPQDNPLQRYSLIQQPIDRGCVAPFGHCNDGKSLYWWAKDGIWSSSKGSLTDADLYNIFPHEGLAGQNVTYAGFTVYAPDYSRAGTFRLAYCNGYLYATYQDTTGMLRALVLDLKRMAWMPDVYASPPTVFCALEQQEGTVLSETERYPVLVAGDQLGNVAQPVDGTEDYEGNPVQCVVCTREWDGGDLRAGMQWGDMWLYSNPTTALTVTPMSFGSPATTPTTVAATGGAASQTPISLGGELLADFLGMMITWADTYAGGAPATLLNAWQPSLIPKPETIADRYTDWYDGGTEQAKYMQGFLLHADTLNAVKGLQARDGDALGLHAFTPAVQHNGESIKAYSFVAPFIAHMVRLEPTDQQPWRFFDVDWIFEPTPESAETWQTQGTAHGLQGYMHVKQVYACYAATQPVTLTITSYDGQSPQPIVMPATGGAMQKTTFILTANKGSLYFYAATSSAPFALFLDSWEIWVGGWSRQDKYLRYRNIGAPTGDQARV